MEDIAKIKTEHTIIVPQKMFAMKFGNSPLLLFQVILHYRQLKVTTVPAYNLDKKFHPKEIIG